MHDGRQLFLDTSNQVSLASFTHLLSVISTTPRSLPRRLSLKFKLMEVGLKR